MAQMGDATGVPLEEELRENEEQGGSVVAQFCLKCLWRIISFLFLKFFVLWPDSAFMNFILNI